MRISDWSSDVCSSDLRRHMVMRQIFSGGAAALALVVTAPVAVAQDGAVGKRVDRLEKQMRAVQRSVFPGGNPAFFEGEIAPDNSPGERVKSGAPVIDLTARVDALEQQWQSSEGRRGGEEGVMTCSDRGEPDHYKKKKKK